MKPSPGKIFAWSFIPAVLLLSAAAWFVYQSVQQSLAEQAIRQEGAAAQAKAGQAGAAVAGLVEQVLLPVAAEIDTHLEEPVEARAQKILDQAKGLELFDGGIYFLDRQGKIILTRPAQPELAGQDWPAASPFRYLADHPGRGVLTEVQAIAPGGPKTACAGRPMLDAQGQLAGAGFYCFAIDPAVQNAFYQALNSLELGAGVYLLDEKQHILFSQDVSRQGKYLSGHAFQQRVLQGPGASRYREGSEARVASYYPLSPEAAEEMPWFLYQEQALAEAMRPSLPDRRLLAGLLALGVIVLALVIAYGVRAITRTSTR